MKLALAVLLCAVPAMADDPGGGAVQGRVVDAQTGEPIAKAVVAVRERQVEAVTDSSGRFRLAELPPGRVDIVVTTVGYGLAQRTVAVGGAEIEVRLTQEALRRAETVAVTTSALVSCCRGRKRSLPPTSSSSPSKAGHVSGRSATKPSGSGSSRGNCTALRGTGTRSYTFAATWAILPQCGTAAPAGDGR